MAKLSSDTSEIMLAKIHRESGVDSENRVLPHATEILPDEAAAISEDVLARLRQQYGEDWCVLPLNDYVTEYAATICSHLADACYPPGSAEIVKRKHALRRMWNELAGAPGSRLRAVEYCYVEQGRDGAEFDYHPSPGFGSLPEQTPLVVKPDELSSSIEIHYAASKAEAVAIAQEICEQLRSKWYEVGRSIGTEVRPRVIMETAIERSSALHPGAEYSITPDERIALVEGHLRPAGGRIMELVEQSTGLSPTGALCEALAQRKANFSFQAQRSCGIFWMVPDRPLEKVTEVKVERTAIEGLYKDLYINDEGIRLAENWAEATDWLTRFVHIMATGENLEEIKGRCREVARRVTLTGSSDGRPASTQLKLVIDQRL